MLVIQCVVGEGKGKICLHRKEIGPRLGGKKNLVSLCADFEAFAQDGEGSEGKMQGYCVVCSARARGENEAFCGVREDWI